MENIITSISKAPKSRRQSRKIKEQLENDKNYYIIKYNELDEKEKQLTASIGAIQ